MIKHYLKIALRNIFHDKTYSAINIVGLAIAIACCFLLIFWVNFELSFDAFYPKADRIYRVLEVESRPDGLHKSVAIDAPVAQKIKDAFPEIEAATSFYHEKLPFVYEDREGIMVDQATANPDFFQLFSFQLVEGSIENVLKNNQGVVLSKSTAEKFFGKESAIGKSISFGKLSMFTHTVEAVVEVPQNTHIQFDVLEISASASGGLQYILVKENTSFSTETQQKLALFLSTIKETKNKLAFQSLKDIHLHSDGISVDHDWAVYGDLKQIYLFSLAAMLILVVAIINYVNTSTARAMNRMKEVGVRKISGSTQRQLILRFLSEAFIISFVSVVIAFVVANFFFPEFSMIMGNTTAFALDWNTVWIGIAVCFIITILSGGYAAFYLSSFNPADVFRGGTPTGSKDGLRKVLICVQFCLSISILISTSMIYRQIHFMFNSDTGVDRKNIIILNTNLWYDADDFIKIIKSENPNIIDATIAGGAPYNVGYDYSGVSWEGSPDAIKNVEFAQTFCDYHYANTFGLKMIAGEFIQPGWSWWQNTDEKSVSIVINEAFQRLMGVDNPIGITVKYAWGIEGKIIGIVKDFNFKPLKEPITPLIISFNPEVCTKVYIKTTGKEPVQTLKYILEKYKEMGYPVKENNMPVLYDTVDNDYQRMYGAEIRTSKVLMLFSIFSLCLSLMGIFGMISFMIEKRTKEIAIRKINGAGTSDVIRLFIKEFAWLVGIASTIAIPVSFIVLFNWLQTYAYRTSLSWWIFLGVPALVLLITSFVIAVQVYFTARQNPVESLRNE